MCLEVNSDNWEPADHGINREDFAETFKKAHPAASQWKDGPDSRRDDVFVTVGEGCHKMWLQGSRIS